MKSSLKPWLIPAMAAAFLATLCPCGAASFSANPIADAFVATGPSGSLSSSNFGGAGALAIAAGGLPNGPFQSVMQFDLSGARNTFDAQFGAGAWTVESATLQLTATPHTNPIFNNTAAGLFNISLMQNNSWVEGTGTGGSPTSDGISYNSLQNVYINNAVDEALGTFSFAGGSSGASIYSLGLSPGLKTDLLVGAHLSLRLYAADNAVSYLFASRTGGSASSGPELMLTVVPEPGTVALWVSGLGVLLVWRVSKRAGALR
jgi:hypothetical protein